LSPRRKPDRATARPRFVAPIAASAVTKSS
jgi:hypothetical protein